MSYLSLKSMLRTEFGATKFYSKVCKQSGRLEVDLYFTLSDEGLKSFKDRIVYLDEAVSSFNENKIYLFNGIEDFSYTINKFNRVHIKCILLY